MPERIPRLVTLGSLVLALGLLGLCAHALLAPAPASQGYGVPAVPGAEPWVQAAGLRDGALGVAVLLIVWRQRSALPWVLAGSLVVPLGDVGISLSQGAGLLGATPHLVGCVGVGILLWLSVAESRIEQR